MKFHKSFEQDRDIGGAPVNKGYAVWKSDCGEYEIVMYDIRYTEKGGLFQHVYVKSTNLTLAGVTCRSDGVSAYLVNEIMEILRAGDGWHDRVTFLFTHMRPIANLFRFQEYKEKF